MGDFYAEQLVKRKTSGKDLALKWGLTALTGLSVLLTLLSFSFVFFVITVIFGFLCFWLLPKTDVEFEYLYVNGQLDIDKIFSKSRRKRAARYDLSNMEVIAPLNSPSLDAFRKNERVRTMDFSSRTGKQTVYVMILNTDTERLRVLVELEDRIIKEIHRKYPQKTFFN